MLFRGNLNEGVRHQEEGDTSLPTICASKKGGGVE